MPGARGMLADGLSDILPQEMTAEAGGIQRPKIREQGTMMKLMLPGVPSRSRVLFLLETHQVSGDAQRVIDIGQEGRGKVPIIRDQRAMLAAIAYPILVRSPGEIPQAVEAARIQTTTVQPTTQTLV